MLPVASRRFAIAAVAAILLALVLATPAVAQKRAFTIEDVYRIQSVSEVQISPDGRHIAYLVGASDLGRARRQSHVCMANADGTGAHQVTFSEKSESAPRFSPDGQWIAFVSTRGGDANLYLMPVAGGESRALTAIPTGVSDPVWSPDSRWIAFSTDVYPECGADMAVGELTCPKCGTEFEEDEEEEEKEGEETSTKPNEVKKSDVASAEAEKTNELLESLFGKKEGDGTDDDSDDDEEEDEDKK